MLRLNQPKDKGTLSTKKTDCESIAQGVPSLDVSLSCNKPQHSKKLSRGEQNLKTIETLFPPQSLQTLRRNPDLFNDYFRQQRQFVYTLIDRQEPLSLSEEVDALKLLLSCKVGFFLYQNNQNVTPQLMFVYEHVSPVVLGRDSCSAGKQSLVTALDKKLFDERQLAIIIEISKDLGKIADDFLAAEAKAKKNGKSKKSNGADEPHLPYRTSEQYRAIREIARSEHPSMEDAKKA